MGAAVKTKANADVSNADVSTGPGMAGTGSVAFGTDRIRALESKSYPLTAIGAIERLTDASEALVYADGIGAMADALLRAGAEHVWRTCLYGGVSHTDVAAVGLATVEARPSLKGSMIPTAPNQVGILYRVAKLMNLAGDAATVDGMPVTARQVKRAIEVVGTKFADPAIDKAGRNGDGPQAAWDAISDRKNAKQASANRRKAKASTPESDEVLGEGYGTDETPGTPDETPDETPGTPEVPTAALIESALSALRTASGRSDYAVHGTDLAELVRLATVPTDAE